MHHSSVFNYRQYWKQYLISWVLGTSNFSWCFQQRDSQISIIACLDYKQKGKKKRHRNLSTFKVIILVYRASTFLNNLEHKNKSLLCETENLHENLNCSLMTASPQWSQYQKKKQMILRQLLQPCLGSPEWDSCIYKEPSLCLAHCLSFQILNAMALKHKICDQINCTKSSECTGFPGVSWWQGSWNSQIPQVGILQQLQFLVLCLTWISPADSDKWL